MLGYSFWKRLLVELEAALVLRAEFVHVRLLEQFHYAVAAARVLAVPDVVHGGFQVNLVVGFDHRVWYVVLDGEQGGKHHHVVLPAVGFAVEG